MESRERLTELLAGTDPERRRYLTGLFQNAPDEIIRELKIRLVRKGDAILHTGDPCEKVYIILSGQLAGLDYQSMGRIYYFMDFTRMYVVGDFEIFGSFSEYCVSIRAAKDCCLLELSAQSYLSWVRGDENALFLRLQNIMTVLTSERIMDRQSIFMNCRERLTRFLLRDYETSGATGRHKVRKTQAELADRVGFNVRSVQRSLAALEEEGLIFLEGGKPVLTEAQYQALKQEQKE